MMKYCVHYICVYSFKYPVWYSIDILLLLCLPDIYCDPDIVYL